MTEHTEMVGSGWGEVAKLFGVDLESTARACGAFLRAREVRSASDLLRLIMYYVLSGHSTRQTALWAHEVGLAELSWVAVWKRIQKSTGWLRFLVSRMLLGTERDADLPEVAIRLLDATVVTGPGPDGEQWRIHAGFDLVAWRLTSVELTDSHGGERLTRHTLRPGEIAVGDRGYAHREPFAELMDLGGRMVVRMHCKTFPLETLDGEDFDLLKAAKGMRAKDVREWHLRFRVQGRRNAKTKRMEGGETYPVRLIVVRKTKESTEKEREKIRKNAAKKGRNPDPWSLKAAAYTCVVTNVEDATLDASQVLALYRLRWQVELYFKRLKSILDLGALPNKKKETAQAFLYANLLAAILIETLAQRAGASPPSPGPETHTPPEPLARLG